MKHSQFYHKVVGSVILTVSVLLALPGCSSWVDSSLNVDPNNPQDAPLGLILSGVQGSLAFTAGSDLGRFASLYTQHHIGVTGQHASYYSEYSLAGNEVDNLWQNLYANVMLNDRRMMDKATKLNAPHYRGVGAVIMAMTLGMTSDMWGDVPYTEAFRGDANLKPVFDTQDKVYLAINALLDSAKTDLSAASSVFSPGSDDIMYGGDLSKWLKAVGTLKARYANHLSKRDAAASAAAAIAASAAGFSSNADDMVVSFVNSPSNANPLFSFDQDRNDIRIAPNFASLLNSLQDPRRMPIGGGVKKSTDSIKANNDLGPFYASATSPVVLCSYAELKFIEAEARLRSGDKAGAKTAYLNAVGASLSWFGVSVADSTTYMGQASVNPAGDVTLDHIMTQKYIALYTQMETWTDWRRTNVPSLTPTTGASIPRRLPTPQSEILYNGAHVPPTSVSDAVNWKFSKMWWDQ